MPVLPSTLENEIESRLHRLLRTGDERKAYGGKHPLPKHNARLDYQFNYQEYHRKGDVEHGIEVSFEVKGGDSLVETDISALEMELTRLLQSTLAFNDTVDLEKEPDRFVFIEEILHSFGERV